MHPTLLIETLVKQYTSCFTGMGQIIDQLCQDRLTDGMVHCYLMRDRVAGFGFQAINALFP